MNLSFMFDPTLGQNERNICEAYWEYEYSGEPLSYLKHIEDICHDHAIEYGYLFEILQRCQVCLMDVQCEYCGLPCRVEVPADVPFMRKQQSWFCATCHSFLGGQAFVVK